MYSFISLIFLLNINYIQNSLNRKMQLLDNKKRNYR